MTVLTRDTFHLSKHLRRVANLPMLIKILYMSSHFQSFMGWNVPSRLIQQNRTNQPLSPGEFNYLYLKYIYPSSDEDSAVTSFFKSNLSCKISLFLFCGHWCQILIESVHKVKVLQLFAKSKHIYWIILILLGIVKFYCTF